MDTYTRLMLGNLLVISLWAATDPRPFRERVDYLIKTQSIVYWLLLISLFYLQYLLYYSYPEYSLTLAPEFKTVGVVIYIVGVFFSCWAKITMRGNWGTPAQHNINKQSKLVTNGPFIYSRNPIYVGLFLLLLGFFITLASPLIFLLLPLTLLINNVVKKEEQLLKNHFKDQYIVYMKKVRRYL